MVDNHLDRAESSPLPPHHWINTTCFSKALKSVTWKKSIEVHLYIRRRQQPWASRSQCSIDINERVRKSWDRRNEFHCYLNLSWSLDSHGRILLWSECHSLSRYVNIPFVHSLFICTSPWVNFSTINLSRWPFCTNKAWESLLLCWVCWNRRDRLLIRAYRIYCGSKVLSSISLVMAIVFE